MRVPRGIKMRTEDRNRLKKSLLFSSLVPELQDRLLTASTFRNFAAGTVLWRSGEVAKFVYVLLTGRVGLFDTITEDRGTVIALFKAGDVITGLAALLTAPYIFSGRVVDEARVLQIPIATYRRHVRTDLSLLLATAKNIAERWRDLMVELRDLKRLSADRRLGFYLLAQTGKKNSATIYLTDDQLLIAGMLGVTRESLSRSFAQLHHYGVIKRGRAVTLADIARLRAYCSK
jgi:CRP/FNR family transcriptional activator FtrB